MNRTTLPVLAKLLFLFLLLLASRLSWAANHPSSPPWLSKVKLTGLSDSAGQRLAVINGKTFAAGEAYDIKIAKNTVAVKCLEIQGQSVLVQLQNLPDLYVLNLAGEVLPLARPNPTPAAQPEVTPTPPPAPAYVPQIQMNASARSPARPPNDFFGVNTRPERSGHFSPITLILLAIVFLLGLGLGTGISQKGFSHFTHHHNYGEALLAETIHQHFQRPHLLLNNITLPTPEGTTQIDHILVADTGIFVIETKHYKGWIFGDPQAAQWTQTIYRKKSQFQNPLRQNYAHIKALQSLLNLPEAQFQTVVVFTGDAEFKTDLGPNVMKLAGLISFLSAARPVIFDEGQLAQIVGRIELKRERRSLETDEYHRNHVRRKIAGQIPTAPSPIATSTPAPPVNPDARYLPKD